MTDLLKFSIPGKPDYVQMVRLAIASVAAKADFDMEAIEDIKVSVSEACKNITCHGHDSWSTSYEVVCELSETNIVIRVTDNCGCHDITKGAQQCKCCPEDGNLAIFVIESLMDEASVAEDEAGNKCIVMVKNR